MLCDNCKKNPATRHAIVLVNGQKHVMHLCAECAKNRGLPIDKLPALLVLLSGPKSNHDTGSSRTCRKCGSSIKGLNENGLLGCADCYDTLREELLPVIKRAQGGRTRHTGRRPEGWVKLQEKSEETAMPVVREETQAEVDPIETLRAELKAAVEREEYERAAVLRDEIRALTMPKEEDEA